VLPLRKARERELVEATRSLFDERGALDAPVEEIARTVGIARGLIYRQFSSKEELYVLTVTTYLDDLGAALESAGEGIEDPVERLKCCAVTYAEFCQSYPAFLDLSLSLMHGPAAALYDKVSESVWLRLGQGMSRCVGFLSAILRDGHETGDFVVANPDYAANVLWTQTLGAMHLARIRVGIREAAPGVPDLFRVTAEQIVETCVATALAAAGAARAL
jgi:AcrR family transcriptional regulator